MQIMKNKILNRIEEKLTMNAMSKHHLIAYIWGINIVFNMALGIWVIVKIFSDSQYQNFFSRGKSQYNDGLIFY